MLMFAGGILYLESFRERLLAQRETEVAAAAELVASAVAGAAPARERALMAEAGRVIDARIRIYGPDGDLAFDSWNITGPTYVLRDPTTEPLRKDAARWLDRAIETIAGSTPLPRLEPARPDRRASFEEAEAAAARGTTVSRLRLAPDRTPIAFAATPLPDRRTLLLSIDARGVTTITRAERYTLFLVFLGVLALSLLLTSFLVRTIVRPLRRLAVAAQRVRLGRAREVTVPRFAARRDEIGELARSLSDMTQALRLKIDAGESFAADVAHEIKNPLASLRSALEGLENVDDPALRAQLIAIAKGDVKRMDRLITGIADASRLDAELSRARFDSVDLGEMMATLVALYEERGLPRGVRLALARPARRTACVPGDDNRLGQLARNLVDNAISFSPDGGVVELAVARSGGNVLLSVEDHGPGVPTGAEEKIFQRFYSEREGDSFGRHSGLGLAIARAVAEAHGGALTAANRMRGGKVVGARFTARFPACPPG